MKRIVKSDDYSNHGLPIGAKVEMLEETPEWAQSEFPLDWYTQGGDGDEVAIDPRDLEPVWWHAYGGFSSEYGAYAVMTLGPTGGPDDPTTDPSKTFREITLPLGDDEVLTYLTSWDHAPSDFEKDQIQPEEYREYKPDGTFVEPTTILTREGENGEQIVTHHRTGDIVQELLKGND